VRTALATAAGIALLWTLQLLAQGPEPVDLAALERIKAEGLDRSQVMDVAWFLTDVYGPRLTGSPTFKAAGDFAVRRLTEWGLVNVALEPWGPFGRGWSNERFYAHAVSPQRYPIIGYSKAWTPGTSGKVTAEAVLAVIEDETGFDQYKGKLGGTFVLMSPVAPVRVSFSPQARRESDERLAELAQPAGERPRGGGEPPRGGGRSTRTLAARVLQFFLDEGVVAVITPGSGRGDGGSLLVQSGGSREPHAAPVVPQVVFSAEQYARIARTLRRGIPVTLEVDVENRFYDETLDSFNVIAELPGTDKADELVMLGAHFDSWHTGTGATDNAAGSAVMMEAVRILRATGLPLRRTVRLALWAGEEQGLLGSRAYVQQHFGDPQGGLKPAHAKLAAYFNVDMGTGKIRGIYQQQNPDVGPIFSAWMKPFESMGATLVSPRNTGSTDHISFDRAGLPGFDFVQDPIEYFSRTHHTNQDVFDRLLEGDLKHNAVIVASFVYHAANRDEPLPRKN
jgi:hypothetical protein